MIARSTSFFLTTVLGGWLNAQYVFTVNGTLQNCAPNSFVEIADPLFGTTAIANLDGNCAFSATFVSFVPAGTLSLQAYCLNGSMASDSINYQFDQPGDTLIFTIDLLCGPDPVDCLGIPNGAAWPGTACDDDDASTSFDSWGTECICTGFDSASVVLDCQGIPNGGSLPGTPCFDPNNPVFPLGVWTNACVCAPDSSFLVPDCLGILGGPNHPGGYCDDGNASTDIDLWDNDCQCVGLDSTQVVFDCLGIPNGGNLPGSPCIDNNSPFLVGTWSADCLCAADSTFTFFDCLGVPNGPNMPGSACDDGNPFSSFDAWDANCICSGQDTTGTLDCLGIPGGPNLPGTPCSILPDTSNTVVGNWGPDCVCYAITFDCTGIPGGPNVPGAVCDDGNPITFNDTWNGNCACVGIDTTLTIDCTGIPLGPNLPGTPCFDPNSPLFFGIWTTDCVCAPDSISYPADCLGVLGGPNQPGTICDDGDPSTSIDLWDNSCQCIGLDSTQVTFDCLGQPNGPVLPGTPCIPVNEFPFTINGIWSTDCQCLPDSSLFYTDCLGIENGPNTIGSICDTGDPNVMGYWNSNCECEAYTMPPCTASFVVVPMNVDTTSSEPIMLYIFNTSFGGDGNSSFLWEFGDGAISTDPWPVHAYAGNGPYLLCLTLTDGSGCSSTFCDTLSLDEFGIFGLVSEGDRTSGFMVAVQPGSAPTGVEETPVLDGFSVWPNPVADELSVQLSSQVASVAEVTVFDLNGRPVDRRSWNMSSGGNRFDLPTTALIPGTYILRITTASGALQQRFVRMP